MEKTFNIYTDKKLEELKRCSVEVIKVLPDDVDDALTTLEFVKGMIEEETGHRLLKIRRKGEGEARRHD